MKINHALTSFYLLTLQSIPEEVVQISRHNIYCTNVLDLLVMKIHYFQNIPMSSKTKKFYSNFMDYRLLNFSNPKYLHFTKKKTFIHKLKFTHYPIMSLPLLSCRSKRTCTTIYKWEAGHLQESQVHFKKINHISYEQSFTNPMLQRCSKLIQDHLKLFILKQNYALKYQVARFLRQLHKCLQDGF